MMHTINFRLAGRYTSLHELRWIRPCCVALQITGLIANALVSVAIVTSLVSLAHAGPDCFDGHNVKVAISKQLFSIPIRYHLLISTSGGKSVEPVYEGYPGSCNESFFKANSGPIDIDQISIRALSMENARGVGAPILHDVQISIYRWFPDQSVELYEISKFKERMGQSRRQFEDLPKIEGFYSIDRMDTKPLYVGPFLAVPNGIVTPGGNPIVVNCDMPIAHSQRIDPPHPKAACAVRYEWSPGVVILYRFSEGSHPIEKWPELDTAIRNFVNQFATGSLN